jgi:hypothetical protein
MTLRNRLQTAAFAAVCLLLTSCSDGLVNVTAQLTDNGVPHQLAPEERVALIAESSDDRSPPVNYDATAGPEGSFVFAPADGSRRVGIPPGRYKIKVRQGPGIFVVNKKVNPKLLKAECEVEVGPGSPRLTVDIATGVIAPAP